MKTLPPVAASLLLFFHTAVRAQEKNPYVRTGQIGEPGQTASVDASGASPSKRSHALQAWIGKKVLFMPHQRRDPSDGCPGFRTVSDSSRLSSICDGKIGTIVSVGTEEYPKVIVEVEGERLQTTAKAGSDERPRVAGLLPLEEIDSLRKQLIGKELAAVGGPLHTYDPETGQYGSVEIAHRQRLKVVDVVSAWAANTTSPFRIILQTDGGAEGFYDVDRRDLDAFLKLPAPQTSAKRERAPRQQPSTPAPAEIAPVGDLQLLESKGKSSEAVTEIVGLIRNNTSREYTYVQVNFTVYDQEGNQVGSAFANLNGLEPRGTWKFKAVCFCQGTNFKLHKIKAH